MLIEFTVGNFRSFRDPQTLSMVAAPRISANRRVDENNVFSGDNQPDLLTSTAIYGANASGKSNLMHALEFMDDFVLSSQMESKRKGGIEVEPFRLNIETALMPSHFEIVFQMPERRFRYGFKVTSQQVESEWLYSATSSREAKLFERTGQEIEIGTRFRDASRLRGLTRPNALFLSVAAQFDNALAQEVIGWFEGRLLIASSIHDMPLRLSTMRRFTDGNNVDSIRQLICSLDLGIADVNVVREALNSKESSFPDDMPDELRQALQTILSLPEGEVNRLAVQTTHNIYDQSGQVVDNVNFDLDKHESDGTQKLFALAGPIMDALRDGRVLVVDEFESRLHPLITRELVKLFNDPETNPNHAQLIFTTQDTNLLDNNLFRRDQIWFVEKELRGASQLYSLAEFKGVRNDLQFARNYFQGRFGAIPYLNLRKAFELVKDYNAEEPEFS